MYVFGEDLNLKERRTVKSEQLYEVLTHNTRRAFDPEAWAGPNSKTYHLEDGKRLNAFYIYDVANSPKALKTQFDEKGKRFRTPKRLSEGPSYIDLRPFLIQEERQLNQDSRKLNMETKKKVKINEDQVLAAQSSGKKELKRKSHGDDNDSIVVPRDKKKKKTNVPEVIDVKAVKKGTKKKKSGKKDMKAKLEQESKMDEEILKKMAIMTPVLAEGANSVTPQIEGDIIKVDGEPSEKLKKKDKESSETANGNKIEGNSSNESPPESTTEISFYACNDIKCQENLQRALNELSIVQSKFHKMEKHMGKKLTQLQNDMLEVKQILNDIKNAGQQQSRPAVCKLKSLKDVAPLSDEEGDPLVIPDDQVHIGDKKLISKKAIATVEKGWSGMRSRLVELAKLFWPEGDHVNWSLKKGLRRNVVSTQHVESMIKILDTMRWSKTPNLSLKYVKRELGKALSAGDAGGAGDEEAGSNEENKPNTKTQNEDKDRDLKKKDDKKANDNIFSEECVGLHSKTTELLQSVTEILALKNNDHGNTAGIDGLNEIDGEHVEDEEDDSEEDDSEEDEDEDDEEGDSEDNSDNDDGEERGDDKKVGADTDN